MTKRPKAHNTVARDLRSPKFRQRVVEDKRKKRSRQACRGKGRQ